MHYSLKSFGIVAALVLAQFGVVASPTNAASNANSALATIRTNAAAVRSNATIYQWKRVGLESVRIEAAERSFRLSDANKDLTSGMHSAVNSLMKATANHDQGAALAAADKIVDLATK